MENLDALGWETESRIGNCSNRHQGEFKKVLAVCSAGMLRSPTIAWVLGASPYGYNCRAAGLEQSYALIKVDDVLLSWADEIVCADYEHVDVIEKRLKELNLSTEIVNLKLPDRFPYRDSKLVKLIKERYNQHLASKLQSKDES
jgi:predicted protein tyrosine phosphatase